MLRFIVTTFCVMIGAIAAYSQQNTNYGSGAGYSGTYNSAFGYEAGDIVTGHNNSFFGALAGGNSNSTGGGNSFFGMWSGNNNSTGSGNTFIGLSAGQSNLGGYSNVYVGVSAGKNGTGGYNNVYLGAGAGYYNLAGSHNVFVGRRSGYNNQYGLNNVYVGADAGYNNQNGFRNVFIGYEAGKDELGSDKLYIDNSDTSSPLVYGDFSGDILAINGKLGIGATPVGAKLDIMTDNGYELKFNGSDYGNIYGTTHLFLLSDQNLYFGSGGTNSQVTLASGNLGIGTTTPNRKMTVYGSGDTYLNVKGNSGTQEILIGADFNGGIVSTMTNHDLQLRAGGNQDFLTIKSSGNVGVGNVSPAYRFQVQNAFCDGNTWYNSSDKELKENFHAVNGKNILDKLLDLKIEKWSYKTDSSKVFHIGPSAQDFNKNFDLSENRVAISTIDEMGIALVAIQELAKEVTILRDQLENQQRLLVDLLSSKVDAEEIVSRETKLYQNNPNPFNLDTEIRMEIPNTIEQATLYIYNSDGNLVLEKIVESRGIVFEIIKGDILKPGLYFYTLVADGKSSVAKRMILTKK